MSLILNANYLRKVASGLDLTTPTTFKLHAALIDLAAGLDAHRAVGGQGSDTLADYLASASGAAAAQAAIDALGIADVSGLQAALDALTPAEVTFTNVADWDHTHGRDDYPTVVCIDAAGRELIGGNPDYVSRNQVIVRFNSPVSGTMRIM